MSFLCLFGKGTKISKYLTNHDKVYEAVLKLGAKTATGDREGEIIEEKKVSILDEEKIKKVLKSFIRKESTKAANVFCGKSKRKKTV